MSSTASRRWWIVLQAVLLVTTLWFAGRAVVGQWDAVRAVAQRTQLRWSFIVLSTLLVLAVHAALIQSWRVLVTGWGGQLSFIAAARIWTVSNLGKYLPLKVWSIGAMGVLTQREGSSAAAAIGAALIGALLNVGAGFGVVALSSTSLRGSLNPAMRATAVGGSVLFVIGVIALPWVLPPIFKSIARWRGVGSPSQQLSARTIWLVTLVNVVAWIGYGLAFALFAHGVSPEMSAKPAAFVAVYAVSYLGGYLAIFAPGGLGVREAFMTGMLVSLGLANPPDALYLALASRIGLTVVELVPGLIALPFVRTNHHRHATDAVSSN